MSIFPFSPPTTCSYAYPLSTSSNCDHDITYSEKIVGKGRKLLYISNLLSESVLSNIGYPIIGLNRILVHTYTQTSAVHRLEARLGMTVYTRLTSYSHGPDTIITSRSVADLKGILIEQTCNGHMSLVRHFSDACAGWRVIVRTLSQLVAPLLWEYGAVLKSSEK